MDASDASSQSVASVTALLDSSISPPVTPTLGHNPGTEARTQTGTKEPSKEKSPILTPESPTHPTYSPVKEKGKSGGAYEALRRSSPVYPPAKEERTQPGLNESFKRKAAEQREPAWTVRTPDGRELPHLSSSAKKGEENKK